MFSTLLIACALFTLCGAKCYQEKFHEDFESGKAVTVCSAGRSVQGFPGFNIISTSGSTLAFADACADACASTVETKDATLTLPTGNYEGYAFCCENPVICEDIKDKQTCEASGCYFNKEHRNCGPNCPKGYTATIRNLDGPSKEWPLRVGAGTMDLCKEACDNREGGCTSFEFSFEGVEKGKCGTYNAGKKNIGGNQKRPWRSCVRDSTLTESASAEFEVAGLEADNKKLKEANEELRTLLRSLAN